MEIPVEKVINNRSVLFPIHLFYYFWIFYSMISCLTLVSGNFDFSVGFKLIYFKVFTYFLLKKKKKTKNQHWIGTKTIIGEGIFLLYKRSGIEVYWLFSSTRTILKTLLLLHTNYLTQKPAIAFYAVQKTQQPKHNQQKCYNHSLPFKLRNKRTLWCRYGFLAFHGQKCKPSCSVCFPLEIAFNST